MALLISFAFVLILCSSFFLASASALLSYHGNGRNYTLWTGTQGECPLLTDDGSKLYKCLTEVPILNKLPWIISNVMQDSDPVYNHDFLLCRHQNNICRSILEYKDNLSPICNSSFVGCQSALRHLHAMMFTADKTQQQCNNFALKSVRAFFHDYMSSAIDGSLLSEMDVEMNVGLCRFSQYVNILSDKTLCDPGSIIALAGMLGFEACGVKLWELDQDVKPPTSIGRGYTCASNNNPKFIDPKTGQRFPQFDDLIVASNATAMEQFWYLINGHNGGGFRPPDGEVEYSAEASGAAHVIGRVTCPLTGKVGNTNVHARAGYFSPDGPNAVLKQQGSLYGRMWNAEYFAINTQCSFDAATSTYSPPPLGLKAETYPALDITLNNKTTNFGPEGGFCGMPTQFLHTVRLGGFHRIPRFMSITNSLGHNWPNNQYTPTQCTIQTYMFIPWELLTLQKKPLPTSPALDRFLSIAWDGIGTVNSLWDGCDIGCQNPIAANRLCQTVPATTLPPQLQNFNYNSPTSPTTNPTKRPYSHRPTKLPRKSPTILPTSKLPTKLLSKSPTTAPSTKPTKPQSKSPTKPPSKLPSPSPRTLLSKSPSKKPTKTPSKRPAK